SDLHRPPDAVQSVLGTPRRLADGGRSRLCRLAGTLWLVAGQMGARAGRGRGRPPRPRALPAGAAVMMNWGEELAPLRQRYGARIGIVDADGQHRIGEVLDRAAGIADE